MKTKIASVIMLTIFLTTLTLGLQWQIVQAYVHTPVESGQLLHRGTGELVANYGYLTCYDSEEGTQNNVYFFPAIESKASSSNNYFVSTMKITVTGTKPDGSAISGLEFCDLAHLISPNEEGTEWDDALTFIYNVIKWIDPTGITSLITLGKEEGGGIGWSCGTDYDSTAAWAWYDAPAMPPARKERGLQFRFALHCDPDLYGTYTVNLQYYIKIKCGLHYPNMVNETTFYQTLTYEYHNPYPSLSIYASYGGTTNPSPGTHTYPYGTPISVSASSTDPHYIFAYWLLDDEYRYDNPTTVTMDSDHILDAHFTFFNNPPYTPSTPSGPTSGYRNEWYTYSTSTTDPEGDDICYEFEFSGPIPTTSFTTGWFASGQTGSLTVMWETTDPPGTYYVRARAQDVYGGWSGWSSSLTVHIYNRGPNTPSSPSGPSSGYTYSTYTYSTSTIDPDGDNVRYQFSWGDGSTTTTGWYASGVTASASHYWSSTGTYYVKVKAQDTYGAWSGWSSSHTVSISSGGGGGCPILFVWDGMEYVCEGLLDIHDPNGTDIVTDHTLATTPKRIRRTYRLRLTEHPQTISHIDQVKLYAILEDETLVELPLIWAWHSEDGYVRRQLLFSDDWKTDTLGADHNNGTSQSIHLRFLAQPPNMKVTGFLFVIEGNNMYFKV